MAFESALIAENFAEVNARVGLNATQCTVPGPASVEVGVGEILRVSGGDGSAFDLPRTVIENAQHYAEVAKLTPSLLRTADGKEGAPPTPLAVTDHPSDLSASELGDWQARSSDGLSAFSAPEQMRLFNALIAFCAGDQSVVSGLVDIVNRVLFPMPVAIFSAEQVLIRDSGRLVFEGDTAVLFNVGQLVVEGIGCLDTQTRMMFFSHSTETRAQDERNTVLLASGLFANPTINKVPAPWPTPASQGGPVSNGTQPDQAAAGVHTYNSTTCVYDCTTQPSPGSKGGKGDNGSTGSNGAPGGNFTGTFPLQLGPLNGAVTLNYGGGNGQTGGTGGTGGNGGPGGQPGACPSGCTAQYPGTQGQAGDGGKGGNGGPGGSAPSGQYNYSGQASVTVSYNDTNGGTEGAAGLPGQTGTPAGSPGTAGAPGANTQSGRLTGP